MKYLNKKKENNMDPLINHSQVMYTPPFRKPDEQLPQPINNTTAHQNTSQPEDANFYFLRHGETWANRAQIAQGALNDERATLTSEGIQVAEQEAKKFSAYLKDNNILIDCVYVSPTKRTNQTAKIFLNHFIPRFINEAARIFGPQSWGELDGQSLNTIVPGTECPAIEYGYINRDWKPAPCAEFPESESQNETTERTLRGVCEVYTEQTKINQKKQWSVVVVTHSDVIKPLLEHITGSLPTGRIPNCKVHHIKMAGIDRATSLPCMKFIQTIEEKNNLSF